MLVPPMVEKRGPYPLTSFGGKGIGNLATNNPVGVIALPLGLCLQTLFVR